jgi:hypothetical protein
MGEQTRGGTVPTARRIRLASPAQLAVDLAAALSAENVLVVMDGPERRQTIAGRAVAADVDSLFGLVLASDPCVVDARRVHHVGLRHVADVWESDRLLLAPCVFGHEVVAIVLASVAAGAGAAALERAALPLVERFAAAVARDRVLHLADGLAGAPLAVPAFATAS